MARKALPKKQTTGRDALAAAAGEVLDEGARRKGRPPKLEDGERLVTVTVRLSAPLHRAMRYLALDLDTDVSTIIRDTLARRPDVAARMAEDRKRRLRSTTADK